MSKRRMISSGEQLSDMSRHSMSSKAGGEIEDGGDGNGNQ